MNKQTNKQTWYCHNTKSTENGMYFHGMINKNKKEKKNEWMNEKLIFKNKIAKNQSNFMVGLQ